MIVEPIRGCFGKPGETVIPVLRRHIWGWPLQYTEMQSPAATGPAKPHKCVCGIKYMLGQRTATAVIKTWGRKMTATVWPFLGENYEFEASKGVELVPRSSCDGFSQSRWH